MAAEATNKWERRFLPVKSLVLLLWESLTFSGRKNTHGIVVWMTVNAAWLVVHYSGEGLLHSLGLLLVLGGVAVLLTMQLPETSNLYPHWGEYHTSEYVAACRMVAEGEGLVVRARNTMCEWREKAPLQFYFAVIGAILICQMTLGFMPLSWLLHALAVAALLSPLLYQYRAAIQAAATEWSARMQAHLRQHRTAPHHSTANMH